MIAFVFQIVLVSLLASFVLSLAIKWGIVEYVQIHGNAFFSKMFSCYFCLSFWSGVIVSIVFAIFTGDLLFLFCPIFSTNVTKKMI